MNLYELTAVYQRLQNQIENGEDVDGILEVIGDELETKADGYARVIRNMEAQMSAFEAEEKRIEENRKRLKAGIERLKQNLFDSMKATGKEKFKTELFSYSIQKNGGALPVIVDVPTEKLPDDLVQITEKPDLKAIAKYIEETGDLSYAHFGERGESLRIK
jgi:phosphotransferase system IIB component